MPIIRRLSTRQADFAQALAQIMAYERTQDAEIEATVAKILDDVRDRGDAAVLDYTRQYDRLPAESVAALEIPRARMDAALARLEPGVKQALVTARARIEAYHGRQRLESWSYRDEYGNLLGQQVTPLDRVGLYVPGGKAAYPSSVLMNAIPAKVAGVGEIVMVVPAPGGVLNDMVLAAASLAGVDRAFMIGGAQAVAALAFGTETIPQVDKIVGPGNAFVAAAKRRVFGVVGIDMIAGPSEILVICDGKTDPEWIAMDLFSQAEHDELAQSILLSPDAAFIDRVAEACARLLPDMPRREVIGASLQKRGALIEVRDLEEAVELANHIAPEHLELSVEDPETWVPKIRHAGAIFLGRHTCEALGDYCAGPNHVLPTARTARFSSALGVYDFQKRTSLIMAEAAGIDALCATSAALAYGEGLTAHAKSAEYRLRRPE